MTAEGAGANLPTTDAVALVRWVAEEFSGDHVSRADAEEILQDWNDESDDRVVTLSDKERALIVRALHGEALTQRYGYADAERARAIAAKLSDGQS